VEAEAGLVAKPEERKRKSSEKRPRKKRKKKAREEHFSLDVSSLRLRHFRSHSKARLSREEVDEFGALVVFFPGKSNPTT